MRLSSFVPSFEYTITQFSPFSGHFGTVYHGYLIDSKQQETHCAVKSLNSTSAAVLNEINPAVCSI